MNDHMLAWAAGLYDGEGCVSFNRSGGNFQISLKMSDRDAVERFASVCGAHDRVYAQRRKRDNKIIHRHDICSAVEVHRVLNLLLPFMCERRRADARAAIQAIESKWFTQKIGVKRSPVPIWWPAMTNGN